MQTGVNGIVRRGINALRPGAKNHAKTKRVYQNFSGTSTRFALQAEAIGGTRQLRTYGNASFNPASFLPFVPTFPASHRHPLSGCFRVLHARIVSEDRTQVIYGKHVAGSDGSGHEL